MGEMKTRLLFPVGIIDIGSNSVRLMFTDGNFINKKLITTQLGRGVLKDKSLSFEKMFETANAVKELKDLALSLGAKSVFSFATAAVRNAKNSSEFTSLVHDLCGLDIDVVSSKLESELAVLGALQNQEGCVIDIGGASTEIAFNKNGKISYSYSYDVGAVSLHSKYNGNKEESEDFLNKTILEVKDKSSELVKGIGGTISSLAVIDLKLKEYNSLKVDNHYMSIETIENLKEDLYKSTPSKITSNFAVSSKRAEMIAGGASILLSVLKAYNLKGVYACESDNLEGYLRYVRKFYEE